MDCLFNRMQAFADDTVTGAFDKIIIERNAIKEKNLENLNLPDYIFVTLNYETAFGTEDPFILTKIPENTRELYNMMLDTPNLYGTFGLVKDMIEWKLYDKLNIQINVDKSGALLIVRKPLLGKLQKSVICLFPDNDKIYEMVCMMGMKGNVLLIHDYFLKRIVLYMGNEKYSPYSPDKKFLFGKLVYLKAE